MLGSQPSDRDRIKGVLQNIAESRIGICNAELVARPALEKTVSADPKGQKICDRACIPVSN